MTDFYSTLFTTQNPDQEDIQNVTNLIPSAVTQDMNIRLAHPFSKEEVKKALFDLSSSKAPGPDVFTALFYQDAWDTIGDEISTAALGVLNNGDSLKDWNATVVTLILKVKDPSSIKEFRPISLCNVCYKIIARAISPTDSKAYWTWSLTLIKAHLFLGGPLRITLSSGMNACTG